MKARILAALLLLISGTAFSQLKVGSNPSQINKASILELESSRQGLLLPRIPGTNLTSAPLNAAPDGMIIYVTDSASLFIRKNNLWQRMSVDSVANAGNWNTTGNAGLDSTKNFLGTTDQQALIFKTQNAERLRFMANGNIKVASGTIPTGTDQVQVIVIDPTSGQLLQRTIAASAFNNAIASLNGLRDTAQTFAIDSAVTKDLTITSAAGVHTFNLPTQNGNGTTSRGLLSYADWARFDSSARFQILHTLFSNTADNNGISISNGTLTLHAADATHPGAVNTTDQTFGGDKIFKDSLAVGITTGNKANSTFQVTGSMSTNLTKATSNYAASESDNTILADATTAALTVTLPSPTNIAGRMYTIKKIGTGGIDKEVTIATTGGTIDGGNNYIIYNDWTFVTLQTDGTNWFVIKK
ncbi:hypothetical protein F0L74_22100 [Chitinophaga agrisoli]|uniref:Uncharacterized protein n=1 Tax=Chitinophaga agrisoli TaxID=2607653 RepID=A0A5B2VJZ0_9BACT|nr:hypothetical protein [Chitinophaga agrisoli]KAA2238910.1 hypothetical protein F0L74_22100 [Chitinophaga agrisoli]